MHHDDTNEGEYKPEVGGELFAINSEGTEKPRQVLLAFKSIESRNKFIRNRRKLKGKRKGLVILEDLTKENAGKYYDSRQLYKQAEVVAVWTQGGVVYVKIKEESKPTTYDDYIKGRRI